MTRRILDRERLKRATEDSKRILERARGAPDLRDRRAPPRPKVGAPAGPDRPPKP